MLKNHLIQSFEKKLQYTPTSNQKSLFEKLASFIVNIEKYGLFLIRGYAGTGKTSSVSAVVKSLSEFKINCVLLAPTGRAAKVFNYYSKHPAFTVHKKIYRQKSSSDGFGHFVLNKNLHKNTFFIVDEASMINNSSYENSVFGTGQLLDDLIEYVYTGDNCRLILIGDTAQLPPVGLEKSPALNPLVLQDYGMEVVDIELTEVIRQAKDSSILTNATYLRSLLSSPSFKKQFPVFKLENNDVERINGVDLIDIISDTYDKHGHDGAIIINRSNKRANKYNEGIRQSVLYRDSKLNKGDLLMIVKNNYFWCETIEEIDFIANGDIVEVMEIMGYQDLYGFHFADVRVRLIDYQDIEIEVKILLDTLTIESAALGMEDNKKLFYSVLEDYADISLKKDKTKKVKENKFFNALQVKFSYAVTCHKAQGGQWKIVFLDQGYINEDMLSKEYIRWLYTAFTRPIEKLYLINFPDKYFDN
ncbi:MAG: ATP-dependent endonuclease [Bacteroidetes bacterium 4572_117]|nr:MAG: ATP-dependent endonuclease [Bacteroidetes bacterium 4572_117]